MFNLQGPTYPNIQRQVRLPSWSIRISMYQSIPHWKGWVKVYSVAGSVLISYFCVSKISFHVCWNFIRWCFTLLYSFTCSRKPLRSAVYLYLMMTLGLRMTAALWPVYGPPSWVRTGRAASPEARVLSREVRTADYGQWKSCTSNISSSLVLERLSKFSCD